MRPTQQRPGLLEVRDEAIQSHIGKGWDAIVTRRSDLDADERVRVAWGQAPAGICR